MKLIMLISLKRPPPPSAKTRANRLIILPATRVRTAYLQRAAAAPERYAVIDSNRERAAVSLSIEQALDTLFA